jgi:Na+/melibiose symporter-like transporter
MRIIVAIICFFLLSVTTVYVIFYGYDKQSINSVNKQLAHLKTENNARHLDLEDPAVKEILKSSHQRDQANFKISMVLSFVLIVCYLSVLTIYLRRSRKQCKP